ncbi:uncharacterized protein [Lepeophtheirus salmonis]|nr:uncharacterized protein LOC121114413 isoform X1 [Lepeophtheirus salmonis]
MKKVILIPLVLHLLVHSSEGDFMTTTRENDLKTTICSPFKPLFDALSSSMSNRKKRSTIALPNTSAFVISNRLRIPQPPWGFYLIWIQFNFFIRPMFSDTVLTNSSNLNVNLIGRKKRNAEDDNYLVRSLEEDQVSILSKLEEAITKGGMNGRHCVLKAICELQETPIHEWSVLGEMISVLFRPKKGYHSELLDYKKAEKLGSETGKCWSHYPNCPISIFNIIPDLYTKDDVVNINFDGGVESELP